MILKRIELKWDERQNCEECGKSCQVYYALLGNRMANDDIYAIMLCNRCKNLLPMKVRVAITKIIKPKVIDFKDAKLNKAHKKLSNPS